MAQPKDNLSGNEDTLKSKEALQSSAFSPVNKDTAILTLAPESGDATAAVNKATLENNMRDRSNQDRSNEARSNEAKSFIERNFIDRT